jgi:hypothetical protein
MTFDAWLQTLGAKAQREHTVCGEVIVPANVSPGIVQAICDANLVPVICDVTPGCYVLEAQHMWRAVIERTVGIYAPWMYGNVPDLANLRKFTDTFGVEVYAPKPGWLGEKWRTFDPLYEVAARYVQHVATPATVLDTGHDPNWLMFPLVFDVPERLAIFREVARTAYLDGMLGDVTADAAGDTWGAWVKVGDLPGAQQCGTCGVLVGLSTPPDILDDALKAACRSK